MHQLYLYNTLGHKREEFHPISPNMVKFYACGPTVYNYAHIGNYRTFLFEDLLRRILEYFGYKVTMVQNLTDVDDKTIKGSQESNIPLTEYTQKYKDAFFAGLDVLRIKRATHYTAATDFIDEMIQFIKKLEEKGFTYQAGDGSLYFPISKFEKYGQLSNINLDNQRTGTRVKNDEYEKDSVADFALWKAWDEDDGDIWWESPWGRGRPGWHIECSAMSSAILGNHFDLHTGGSDNLFPHHENEIAQSEAANGVKFVNYWLHSAHLLMDGDKMSKSKGNFYKIHELVEMGYSGKILRWVLLSTHYRKLLNFSFAICDQAKISLDKFDALFKKLKTVNADSNDTETLNFVAKIKTAYIKALGDDLNISGALSAVYQLQTRANQLLDSGTLGKRGAQAILEQFRDFDEVLGVFNLDDSSAEIPAKIQKLAEERLEARNNKDWAASDRLRDELKASGWKIEDKKNGYFLIKID